MVVQSHHVHALPPQTNRAPGGGVITGVSTMSSNDKKEPIYPQESALYLLHVITYTISSLVISLMCTRANYSMLVHMFIACLLLMNA